MLRRVHQRRCEGTGLEFERGAWKSPKVELRRTELGVRLLVAVARVFENCLDMLLMDVCGERVNSEFVDVERVAFGEEGGWNDAAEEKTQY